MVSIKKRYIIIAITVFILSITISIFIYAEKLQSVLHDNYENDTRVITGLISNVIDSHFLRPIMVSETMSNDLTTKNILDINSKKEAEETEANAAKHLKSIRDGFGYSLVFAISENARSYFSYDGIRTYIDCENNSYYAWYKNFINSGLKYKLEVDKNEYANWALSVFINTAVYDENNRFIGICGVGIDMNELQNLLSHYEKIYNIKIDLINDNCKVMIDSDVSKVNNEHILIENIEQYSDGECYYEIRPEGDRTITYLENLDWYLVITNQNTINKSYTNIFLPITICMVVSLAVFTAIFISGTKNIRTEENKTEQEKTE